MNGDLKTFAAIIGSTLLLIFGAAFLLGKGNGSTGQTTSNPEVIASDILVKDNSWGIGSSSATLTVVEFSDFQCPACKLAEPETRRILGKYRTQMKFYYRHFPLPLHEFSFDAAVAAEAAGKQGVDKFWKMHDKLFDKQPEFQREKLIGYAKDLGLDVEKFTKDLDSEEIRQRVLDDQADGKKAGVDSTPTFFVNGVKLSNYSNLDSEISSRLK